MSRPFRRLWAAGALAVSLVGVFPQIAFTAGSFSSAESARSHATDSPSRKTKQYWTEARMRAAEENDLDSETEAPEAPTDQSPDGTGPTTIDPQAPELDSDDSYRSARLRSGSGEIPYTREEISDGDFPYITHGRVFFRSGGVSYSCSGTVVTTANRSVVWTAGHCVNHGGREGWVNKWIFVPGYDDGEAPYGKWTAKTLAAPRGWINYGSAAYDMGAAVLNPNSNGEFIADVVGSLGIAWNLPRRQEFTIYGYPAAGAFDGGSL